MNTIVFYSDVEFEIFNRRELIYEIASLLPRWRIVVINRPACVIPNIFRKSKVKYFLECLSYEKHKQFENIELHRPLTFVHEHIIARITNGYGSYLLSKYVGQIIDNKAFDAEKDQVIIWIYEQTQWMLGRSIQSKNKRVVWEIFDDYRMTADGCPRPVWIKCEKYMLRNVDQIFTLTENLKNKYKDYGIPVNVIGNGYPDNIFYRRNESIPELDDSSKIIMYLGVIRNWIDFSLVKKVLSYFSDHTVVFVGPVENDVRGTIESLICFKNFKLISKVNREMVPSYMSKANVAIIPYIQSDFTKSVKPIKLYEFLACGVPVVTTTSADIATIEGVLYCSKTVDKFIDNIEKALLESKACKCIDEARPWSWNHVARKVIDILEIGNV